MKSYKVKAILIIVFELIVLLTVNLFVFNKYENADSKMYRVEAGRIVREIESTGNIPDLSTYSHIDSVSLFDPNEICNDDYLVYEINGELYRVIYHDEVNVSELLLIIDLSAGLFIVLTAAVLIYISVNILNPFNRFTDLPYELSKGNLVVPVKENKNKYFGKFLWGMDMLRGNLEQSKEEELKLLKEKKTLVLSLSHDIKTPLSSIKLYSKALSEDLYQDETKKKEIYEGITKNALDIENYVNEIIRTSKEDFLNLSVNVGEVYLSDVLNDIRKYYKDKLSVKHIDFSVEEYSDALLSADKDRLIEVIQNVVENAIKYGDGGFIKITVSEEEDCKLITISNSGEVVSSDEVNHLFDSFYRGTNVGNQKGSGLGLYICRKLMNMMDGEIFADMSEGNPKFVIVVHMA